MFKRAARALLLIPGFVAATVCAQTLEIDGEIFRDPTQPPNAVLADIPAATFDSVPQFNASNFKVSFIRSGGINPVAVINNRTVTVGDEMEGGVRVSEIRAGTVVLSVEGQDHLLNLYDRPVRQDIQPAGQ